MDTKLDKVLTYYKKLSDMTLWSSDRRNVMWSFEKSIYPLSQCFLANELGRSLTLQIIFSKQTLKWSLTLCCFFTWLVSSTKKPDNKLQCLRLSNMFTFELIRETITGSQIFEVWLWLHQTNIDIMQAFSNVKPKPEAYLEPSRTSKMKLFCDFCKEALLGSICAST